MKRQISARAVPTAEEWNARHSVGTAVEVTRWRRHDGTPVDAFRSRTRSTAWTLSEGHAVVQVEGSAGSWGLDFVRPLGDLELAACPICNVSWGSTHPTGCPNYGITDPADRRVVHVAEAL